MSHMGLFIRTIRTQLALNRLARVKKKTLKQLEDARLGHVAKEKTLSGQKLKALLSRAAYIFLAAVTCARPRTISLREDANFRQLPCVAWFLGDSFVKEILKNFLGFIFGSLLTLFLYAVLVSQVETTAVSACAVCSIVGFVFTLGMAFSPSIRCVLLLAVPGFFSSKGRTFLILYAFSLVFSHPVRNFNNNLMVMSEAVTCGQEIAYNQTRKLIKEAIDPLSGIVENLRKFIQTVERYSRMTQQAFLAMKKGVEEICASIKRIFAWLGEMVNVCNAKMQNPYIKCELAFRKASENCRRRVPSVLRYLCSVVSVVKALCSIAKVLNIICVITRVIKTFIGQEIGKPIAKAITSIHDLFYFKVTISYEYEVTLEQSKDYQQVRADVLREVKDRLAKFMYGLDAIKALMLLSIVFIFFRAEMYRRKYRSKDGFDNIYITKGFKEMDARRAELLKETLIPLKGRERKKYIKMSNPKFSSVERNKFVQSTLLLTVSVISVGFYLLCDYGLYWILAIIRKHFSVELDTAVPPHLKLEVDGDGAYADMYRSMVSLFDPLADVQPEREVVECLPNPLTPNYSIYKTIGYIFGFCLLSVLVETYCLRLRHVIAGYFHPERAKERAAWLYNTVLRSRGGFVKFLRRKLKKEYQTSLEVEKISLRGRLAARFPIFRKILAFAGYDVKICLSCGKEGEKNDLDNFQHCNNDGCKAVYCMDCFYDINNMCTVCLNPVDYSDFSDVSEERDSSEDEEEIARKKLESARRKAQWEKSHPKRTVSTILENFYRRLGIKRGSRGYFQIQSSEVSRSETSDTEMKSKQNTDVSHNSSCQ